MAEQAWYKTHALKLHVIKKHRYRYNTNISNFLALGLQKLYHIPKLCWNSISDGCNFLYISMKINKSLARYKFTYLISYRLDYVLHVGVYWKQICSFINDIKRAAFWKSIPYTSRYKRYFHRNAGCYARREGDTEAVLGQPIPYESAHLWNKRRDVTEGRYAW